MTSTKPHKQCSDATFRLSVYEAGHTITAYLLNQKIVAVRMLPRPPMTIAEKKFISNSWESFMDILENRALELFGGQIAEEMLCGNTTCCSGDISRIDEISRILAGLSVNEDYDNEDILFSLEDRAIAMFAPEHVRNAILPVAKYLYDQDEAGEIEVSGKEVTKIIEQYIPRPPKEKGGLLSLLRLG
ncbi:hypothetical protein [Magnetovibrio blakemorei]|uniref:Peptidase M41 domain-containing protein n=1 Tax=Magnetovibrio blakemorei TaxID=28181 RepID=A0A1E5Q8X3_9PROT|nr:hypothetical protein [Magnetovibrio blakemorei]OEJ67916.1 hypothetical protein BEN30_07920 [Magnetovibrio blakemorei]